MKIPVKRYLYAVDVFVWMLAIFIGAGLRYDFQLYEINWYVYAGFVPGTAVLLLLFGVTFRLYRRGAGGRPGEFQNALAVAFTSLTVGVTLWIFTLVVGGVWGISRSVMLIATPVALVMMLAARFLTRVLIQRTRRPGPDATPVLVFGGGSIGTNLIRWMMSDPQSSFRPVGVIDDDLALARQKIQNVPVLGTLEDLEAATERTGAKAVIVAIADADAALLRRVQRSADVAGLSVKVMPPIGHVIAHGVRGQDLRDLSIEDLLGRQPVTTNVSEIAQYLKGKRVLITGAGGSIGSQLCTEVAKYRPAELIMLDRDETGLQQALLNVHGNGLLDTDAVVLADIRDAEALLQIFRKRKPEVVFHAAALKHLPMLEQYPEEAWKTNILGTLNVLRAADAVGVQTFVNISTDKAANPTSVLGYSKRMAEKLTAWFGESTGRSYISVRFGNVIGSRGSMLPTFIRLINEEKPLTVTHPEATRFFMTIPEACQLVLQAGGIGRGREVLILDMGKPVNIHAIAKRLIAMSGKDIEIVFTGLRAGEKLHEDLVDDAENAARPYHRLISHAEINVLHPDDLDREKFMNQIGKNVSQFRSSVA